MSGAINTANSRQNIKRDQRYKPYKLEGRREINKAFKLMRHLRNFADDLQAQAAFENIPIIARDAAKRKYNSLTPNNAKTVHQTL